MSGLRVIACCWMTRMIHLINMATVTGNPPYSNLPYSSRMIGEGRVVRQTAMT